MEGKECTQDIVGPSKKVEVIKLSRAQVSNQSHARRRQRSINKQYQLQSSQDGKVLSAQVLGEPLSQL